MKKYTLHFISIIILATFTILPVCQAEGIGEKEGRIKAKIMFDKAVTLIEKEGLHKAFYDSKAEKSEKTDSSSEKKAKKAPKKDSDKSK